MSRFFSPPLPLDGIGGCHDCAYGGVERRRRAASGKAGAAIEARCASRVVGVFPKSFERPSEKTRRETVSQQNLRERMCTEARERPLPLSNPTIRTAPSTGTSKVHVARPVSADDMSRSRTPYCKKREGNLVQPFTVRKSRD